MVHWVKMAISSPLSILDTFHRFNQWSTMLFPMHKYYWEKNVLLCKVCPWRYSWHTHVFKHEEYLAYIDTWHQDTKTHHDISNCVFSIYKRLASLLELLVVSTSFICLDNSCNGTTFLNSNCWVIFFVLKAKHLEKTHEHTKKDNELRLILWFCIRVNTKKQNNKLMKY